MTGFYSYYCGMTEKDMIDEKLSMTLKSMAWIKREKDILAASLLKRGYSTKKEQGMIDYLHKKNQWEDRQMEKIMAE